MVSNDAKQEQETIKSEWEQLTNSLLLPLKLSCESGNSQLIEVALDCFAKLIEHEYINGGQVSTHVIDVIKLCHEKTKDDNIHQQILKIYLVAVATPGCKIHDNNILTVIKVCYNIYLKTSNPENMRSAKTTLLDILKLLFSRLEQESLDQDRVEYTTAYNDCYQVFKGLCKYAMKPLSEGVTQNIHTVEVRWKLLSLELLSSIFEFSQDSFKHNTTFINNAIKKYLFDVIVENGISPITTIFGVTTSLFFSIVMNYRQYMKVEIESFFYSILLPILDKLTSTVAQKFVVLKCVHSLCKNPQVVLDLFLNYDCSTHGHDILETVVRLVSKVAQKKIPNHLSSEAYEQEKNLKNRAMVTLVCFINACVEWSRGFYNVLTENIDTKTEFPRVAREDDEFDKIKKAKMVVDKGRELFKISYKKGMEYFFENDIVEKDDLSVAKFLRNTPGLDKVVIGEMLGHEDKIQLLETYVHLFDFSTMELDFALREYLSYFWLPGEGQKVSRFMETFGEEYYKAHSTEYGNSTAVYFLSMAIIMLATDLHNPSQKVKITRPEWKKLLVGQNDGKDYDDEMLDKLFERIAAEELKVKNDALLTQSTYSQGMTEKQRIVAYNIESKVMLERCKEDLKMKSPMEEYTVFHDAKDPYHINLLFSITWHSLLGALSQVMEETDDMNVVKQCLEGISGSIHLACIFNTSTERETFVKTLAQLTFLDNFREIKLKNVEAIKTLIEVAEANGNFLRNSWSPILKCLSCLERLLDIGSGGSRDDEKGYQLSKTDTPKRQYHTFEEVNSSLISSHIQGGMIDRIFINSSKFAHYAVLDFVECLCEVSREELHASGRTYSLQKLSEVADYNMARPVDVWSQLWEYLSAHYIESGLSKNESAALLAADSLRQLAAKRLTMKGISDQRSVLRPFESIIAHENKKIREYIVFCIAKLMTTLGKDIKTGWICFIRTLEQTCTDVPEIVELSFEQLEEIAKVHFQFITEQYYFVDFVNCISKFACNPNLGEKIGGRALELIKFCSEQLLEDKIPIVKSDSAEDPSDRPFTLVHKEQWFCLLKALARTIQSHLINTRLEAHEILFSLLNTHLFMFSPLLLKDMFLEILIPIFDIVLDQTQVKYIIDDSEWLITTCLKALHSVTLLFCKSFEEVNELLQNILELLSRCINQNNESLATFGVAAFETLLSSSMSKYDDVQWSTICLFLKNLHEDIIPVDFYERFLVSKKRVSKEKKTPEKPMNVTPEENVNSPKPKRRVTKRVKALYGRIRIQNLLLKCVKEQILDASDTVMGLLALSKDNCFAILDSLYFSYTTIYTGIRNESQEPHIENTIYEMLLNTQSELVRKYTQALFLLLKESNNDSIVELAESKILANIQTFVKTHMNDTSHIDKLSVKQKKVYVGDEDLLVLCLESLLSTADNKFIHYIKELYPCIIELSLSRSLKVRNVLKSILERIGETCVLNK